jgi:hypothetical protein
MTLRRILFASLLLAVLGGDAWAQGAWPTSHHDEARSGRAAMPGDITDPAVVWQHDTGGHVRDEAVLIADITGDGNPDSLIIVGGAVVARRLDGTLIWDTPAYGLTHLEGLADLDGDGRPELVARGSIFLVLDTSNGRELWRLEGEDGQPLRNSQALLVNADQDEEVEVLLAVGRPVSMALYDFSQGWADADARRWTNTDEALPTAVYRPVIGDFEGSAEPGASPGAQVAVVNQDNCRVVFIDLLTGVTQRVTDSLTQGRFCYGLTQAIDLDGQRGDELLVTGAVGASQGSVSVTVYSYALQRPLWQYEYGAGNADTATLTPAGAVGDIDGDGAPEVVLAVFDNTTEVGEQQDGVEQPGRWSVTVYDGATGRALLTLPDRVVVGFANLDDDPQLELITRETTPDSRRIPTRGAVAILDIAPGGAVERAIEFPSAEPVTRTVRDPRINSRDSGVVPAVFSSVPGERGGLLLIQRVGESEHFVSVTSRDSNPVATAPVQTGVQLTYLGLFIRGDGQPLAMIKTDTGRLRAYDGALTKVEETKYTGHLTSAVMSSAQVYFRDSALNLVALDGRNGSAGAVWRRPVASAAGEFAAAPDGYDDIAQAGIDDAGVPFIETATSRGAQRWRRTFPDARSAPTSLLWGWFGGSDAPDLATIVTDLDGTRHTITLDGDTGATLVDAVSDQTPPLFQLLRVDDRTGDGLHELLALHLVSVEILNGVDLAPLADAVALPQGDSRPVHNTLYPIGETDVVFLNLFRTEKVALDSNAGTILWRRPSEPSHNQTEGRYAGFADVNQDGIWDIAMPGVHGDITVFDGLSGATLRRLCLDGGRDRKSVV